MSTENFFTYLPNLLKLQSLRANCLFELSFWNRAEWRQEDPVCTKCFSWNFFHMQAIIFCTNEGTAAESWIFRWRNLRPEFPSLIEFRNHKKSVHIHQNRSTWRRPLEYSQSREPSGRPWALLPQIMGRIKGMKHKSDLRQAVLTTFFAELKRHRCIWKPQLKANSTELYEERCESW